MPWRQRYNHVRPVRPKARSLKADETGQISARFQAVIDRSPVVRALGLQVRGLRGRFYLDWRWDPGAPVEEVSCYGRITPLEQPPGKLLLEAPYGQDQWTVSASMISGMFIRLALNHHPQAASFAFQAHLEPGLWVLVARFFMGAPREQVRRPDFQTDQPPKTANRQAR